MDILSDKRIGVYQIRNTTNGKVYVGSTAQSFQQRAQEHLSALQRNIHHCRYLQRAWNKHGNAVFVFEVIESVLHPEQVIFSEQAWIDFYKAQNVELYNAAPQAASSLGYRFTDEQRARMTAVMQERYRNNSDALHQLSERMRDFWARPDTRAVQSERVRKQMQSDERRQIASDAGRKAWDDPHFRARMSSPERCANISEGKAWRVWPDLISPEGEIVSGVRNMITFCKTHGLHKSAMTLLFQGKRPQHKGWRLRYPMQDKSE